MKYVVGIVYNKENILLISKKRPTWQVGMLNGIGGKIEPGENPLQAMIRECKEECNLDIEDWVVLKTVSFGKDETLTYFKAYSDMKRWKSLTDEDVIMINRDKFIVDYINDECFINTRYSGVLKLSLSEIEPLLLK